MDYLTRAVFSIHEYPYVLIPDTINLQKIKSRYSILQSSDPAEKGIVFYAELMGRLIEFFAEAETEIIGIAKAAGGGYFRESFVAVQKHIAGVLQTQIEQIVRE